MKAGKDIDQVFKEGLQNPDIPFNDLDWDNLEQRLHPKPKRKIVPLIWLGAAAGIAAMLLVVFLLNKPTKNKLIAKKPKQSLPYVAKPKPTNLQPAENNSPLANTKDIKDLNNVSLKPKSSPSGYSVKNQITTPQQNHLAPNNTSENLNNNLLANNLQMVDLSPKLPQQAEINTRVNSTFTPTKVDKRLLLAQSNKPSLVLSILAAPDLTSVQRSGRSSLSGSFGVEATLKLTKRLSITSGLGYAKKIYDANFNLYRPNTNYVFKVNPSNIHANCDVIDVPLNVNYKLFEKGKNALAVSTGLSSYFMLNEQYNYTYPGGAADGPASYQVKNQNQHIFGIANVGVEYQHKINQKLGVSIRPFMKIPLTNIGYGNSKLASTGVAVSLNMNLFNKNR